MDILLTLEQKVVGLIDVVRKLQADNAQLQEQATQLRAQVELFENSLLHRDQHAEERSRELAQAKVVVDELIQAIDLVVEHEVERHAQKNTLKAEQA